MGKKESNPPPPLPPSQRGINGGINNVNKLPEPSVKPPPPPPPPKKR